MLCWAYIKSKINYGSILEMIKMISDFFIQGGMVMIPLSLCSVLVVAISVYKLRLLKYFSNQLMALDQKENRPTDSFFQKSIEVASGSVKEIDGLVWDFEKVLSNKLWLIGSIASLSPFIGLFGTVVGIIKSFSSLAEAGKGGFSIVSADLSEALIATAAGIFVAIIASFSYNYFIQRITKLKKDFGFVLLRSNELLER